MSATCQSLTGRPAEPEAPLVDPLRAATMSRKSSGRFRRALICTTRSCSAERIAPSGSSWFSLRSAATTCSTPMPSASIAEGRRWTLISRLRPPTTVTEPTPRTFSRRFCSTWVAQVVSSWVLRLAVARQHGDVEDRLAGRVEAEDARLLDLVAQQRAHQRHLLAHVLGGARPSMSRLNSTTTTEVPS